MATTTHKQNTHAAAADVLRALAAKVSGRRARIAAGIAPIVVEFAIAIAIGIAAAKLVFAVFAPSPTPERLPTLAPAQSASASAITLENTPFRIAAVEASAPPPDAASTYEETQLDLTLHGVFVFEAVPTAIISTPDGKQGSFGLGGEIWSDASLERIVSAEQVVIVVSGARETLTLKNRDPKQAARDARSNGAGANEAGTNGASPKGSRTAPRPGQAAPPGILPVGDVARLSLAQSANGLKVVVQPGPNRSAFNAAGLKPGDVLVSINNRRIGADLASESKRFATMARTGRIRLLVERNGTPVPVEIDLTEGG